MYQDISAMAVLQLLLLCFRSDETVCALDGYFPHPTDCRRFFWCSGGVNHPFSCPDDLAFDVTTKTCRQQHTVMSCWTSVTTPMTYHSSHSPLNAVTPEYRTEATTHGSSGKSFGEPEGDAGKQRHGQQQGNGTGGKRTRPEGIKRYQNARKNTTETSKTFTTGVQVNTAAGM